MRRLRSIIGGITANTAGFAALQAQTGGTGLTLATTAAPAATAGSLLPNAVAVTLTSAGNLSAGTFTAVGTDRRGNFLSEVITGPNANTVSGHFLFGTVTSITPNTTNATTVSAGWAGTNYGPWLMTAFHQATIVAKAISGTPSIQVGVTTQNILDPWQFQPDGGGGQPEGGKSGSPVYANGNYPLVPAALQTAAPWLLSTNLVLPEDDGTYSGMEPAPTTFTAAAPGGAAAAGDQIRLDPTGGFAWRLIQTSAAGLIQLDVTMLRPALS